MEPIKFQLNHCYSCVHFDNDYTTFYILQKRTKKECTFLEISQDELRQKSRLITTEVYEEVDYDTNRKYESCNFYIDKHYEYFSSTSEVPIPLIQFNPQSTYIAYAHTGRRKIYFLHILEREGNKVYVELYGSSFKTFIHTKILKPINGYYEIINIIVKGEQLTFKSNFYNFLLTRATPEKMEALKKSAEAIQEKQIINI